MSVRAHLVFLPVKDVCRHLHVLRCRPNLLAERRHEAPEVLRHLLAHLDELVRRHGLHLCRDLGLCTHACMRALRMCMHAYSCVCACTRTLAHTADSKDKPICAAVGIASFILHRTRNTPLGLFCCLCSKLDAEHLTQCTVAGQVQAYKCVAKSHGASHTTVGYVWLDIWPMKRHSVKGGAVMYLNRGSISFPLEQFNQA